MALVEGEDQRDSLILCPATVIGIDKIDVSIGIEQSCLKQQIVILYLKARGIQNHHDLVSDLLLGKLIERLTGPYELSNNHDIGCKANIPCCSTLEEGLHCVCLFGKIVSEIPKKEIGIDERISLSSPILLCQGAPSSWLSLLLLCYGRHRDSLYASRV